MTGRFWLINVFDERGHKSVVERATTPRDAMAHAMTHRLAGRIVHVSPGFDKATRLRMESIVLPRLSRGR